MNRPRRLCWGCYYEPGVKDLYPITSKYATHAHRGIDELDADLDELVAEMDRLPEFPPEVRPVFGSAVPEWSRLRTHVGLSSDTEAGEIAARQREEVADFFASHPAATNEEVSEALVLPVWSVLLRLAELRGEPPPYTNAKRTRL